MPSPWTLGVLGALVSITMAQSDIGLGVGVGVDLDVAAANVDIDIGGRQGGGCSHRCTVYITSTIQTITTVEVTKTETAPAITLTEASSSCNGGGIVTLPGTTITEIPSCPESGGTITVTESPSSCSGVTSTVTLPATTITKRQSCCGSGTTVTRPGETVSVPGPTVTETDYETQTSYTTIWQSTVLTTIVEYPVTVTQDNTIVTTSISTSYETITTSVPVTSLVTQTATITAPGETITSPGQTVTVPGQVITRPGETIINTITVDGPVTTTTITRDGQTITTTLPGLPVLTTVTQIIPPTTVSSPGITVTATPIFDVTLCPLPTGASAPLDKKSDLTFGCKPGYVCNPRKPSNCNFWPDYPNKDYLCAPEECIPTPPFQNVTWEDGKTGYYPPSFGYFDLNPEVFGLSYDIFEYHVEEEVEYGTTHTITTGNWGLQTTSEHTSTRLSASQKLKRVQRGLSKRLLNVELLGSTDIDLLSAGSCYDSCNSLGHLAQSIGKTDALCAKGGPFAEAHGICTSCLDTNQGQTQETIRDYIDTTFLQFFEFCSGGGATEPVTSAPGPDPVVTAAPTVDTGSQIPTASGTFSAEVPSVTTTATSEQAIPSSQPAVSSSSSRTVPSVSSSAEAPVSSAKPTTAGSPETTSSQPVPSSENPSSSSRAGGSTDVPQTSDLQLPTATSNNPGDGISPATTDIPAVPVVITTSSTIYSTFTSTSGTETLTFTSAVSTAAVTLTTSSSVTGSVPTTLSHVTPNGTPGPSGTGVIPGGSATTGLPAQASASRMGLGSTIMATLLLMVMFFLS